MRDALLTEDVSDQVMAIVSARAGLEGPLLPILHDVQAAFGYIPSASIPLIAKALNLTRAEVFGVVSFYHDYRDTPRGNRVLKVCRAEACQAMGGEALAARIRELLGVDWGGTSADGAVTLEPVYCLGLCASAPALMLDGEVHGRVTHEMADAVLAECRS